MTRIISTLLWSDKLATTCQHHFCHDHELQPPTIIPKPRHQKLPIIIQYDADKSKDANLRLAWAWVPPTLRLHPIHDDDFIQQRMQVRLPWINKTFPTLHLFYGQHLSTFNMYGTFFFSYLIYVSLNTLFIEADWTENRKRLLTRANQSWEHSFEKQNIQKANGGLAKMILLNADLIHFPHIWLIFASYIVKIRLCRQYRCYHKLLQPCVTLHTWIRVILTWFVGKT